MYGIPGIVDTCKSLEVVEVVAAEEVHHTIREVIGGVECQMFQHVRQPQLLVRLQDGTHILVDIILCFTRSRTIIIDIIGKAVRQLSRPQTFHLRMGSYRG